MKTFTKLLKIVGLLWIAVIFYFFGYLVGHKNLVFEKNYKPVIANTQLGQPKSVDFSIFWDAWNSVTDKFVGNIDTQKMVFGAIKGMIDSLGDPYSQFLEPGQQKNLLEDLSGQIQGIGAELTIKDGKLVIVTPLSDSPAQKAGLKPQDEILQIDGQDTSEMTLDQAISKIRGQSGTEVTLQINRQGFTQPQDFKIKRETIVIKSVNYEMKGNIGYIKISQFGDDTSNLAKLAAEDLAKQNPKAIILDLRDDPGGYLDAAVDVASLFMNKGVVVKEQYRDGRIEELKTTLEGILAQYKVIVLVNEGSASAQKLLPVP